jgi:hypothetical protein
MQVMPLRSVQLQSQQPNRTSKEPARRTHIELSFRFSFCKNHQVTIPRRDGEPDGHAAEVTNETQTFWPESL